MAKISLGGNAENMFRRFAETAEKPAVLTTIANSVVPDQSSRSTLNPNELLAMRGNLSLAGQNRAFLPAKVASQTTNTDSAKQNFPTSGGSWRTRDDNGELSFYRDGADNSGTSRFDKEYFQTGEDDFVRLNAKGALRDLAQNRGKPQPAAVADFDWQGWERVSAAKVPADYTTRGKTVAFGNPEAAANPQSLFKRYLADNKLLDGATWDEAKVAKAYRYFDGKRRHNRSDGDE